MNQGKSKFQKIGNSLGVLIPSDVAKDSIFPFHIDDELDVKIEGNKIVLSKSLDLKNNAKVSDYVK